MEAVLRLLVLVEPLGGVILCFSASSRSALEARSKVSPVPELLFCFELDVGRVTVDLIPRMRFVRVIMLFLDLASNEDESVLLVAVGLRGLLAFIALLA